MPIPIHTHTYSPQHRYHQYPLILKRDGSYPQEMVDDEETVSSLKTIRFIILQADPLFPNQQPSPPKYSPTFFIGRLPQWRSAFLLQHIAMLRNQQFILMHPPASSSYLTPDKRPTPDTSTKGLSASISRPNQQGNAHIHSPQSVGTSQYRPLLGREAAISQKLGWFQQRTERLRAYLDSSPQLEHQRIQEIFGWTAERLPEETKDKRVLKDLSAKVRALIRENSELRGSTPTEDLLLLRRQKEELEAMVDQLRRGESAREAILSEENQYLRDYISRRKEDGYRSTNNKPEGNAQQQGEQPQIKVVPPPAIPTQVEVANLRKYVMAYINTVIESNDEKLQAQQKYLQTLDKRLSQLGKYEELLTHLRFQRTVKLQQSGRKSKNFTTGVPLVQGDEFQYEPDPTIPSKDSPPQVDLKSRYFSSKKKEPTVEEGLSKKEPSSCREMAALVLRSAQLQEQLNTLQQKYDVEIESHIRDSSDREELVIAIQKLNAEKADLKHQNEDLQQQLRAAHRKISQLERGAGKFRGKDEGRSFLSIQQELADIKRELISCGVQHYEAVQQQLAFVFAERDRLRRDLQQLQAMRVEDSRFSSATKEIFLLKEKNSQLQQNCRFYQQQIQQYEQQLRQVSQESERQLAKAISRDFREMRAGDEELQGLKWPRMAHSCMVNSIHRLENIQKQLSITNHH